MWQYLETDVTSADTKVIATLSFDLEDAAANRELTWAGLTVSLDNSDRVAVDFMNFATTKKFIARLKVGRASMIDMETIRPERNTGLKPRGPRDELFLED